MSKLRNALSPSFGKSCSGAKSNFCYPYSRRRWRRDVLGGRATLQRQPALGRLAGASVSRRQNLGSRLQSQRHGLGELTRGEVTNRLRSHPSAAQSCPMDNKKCQQSDIAARVILHESQKPVPSHEALQTPPSSSYNPCSLGPAVLCRLGVGSRAAALPEGRGIKNDCSRRICRRHSGERT